MLYLHILLVSSVICLATVGAMCFSVRWLRLAHFFILWGDYLKFGMRKPSLKKSFKAHTTGKLKRKVKKSINPLYGKKGMGFAKNTKKSIRNKIYHKTTFSWTKLFK